MSRIVTFVVFATLTVVGLSFLPKPNSAEAAGPQSESALDAQIEAKTHRILERLARDAQQKSARTSR
jgi:hypothetical protein